MPASARRQSLHPHRQAARHRAGSRHRIRSTATAAWNRGGFKYGRRPSLAHLTRMRSSADLKAFRCTATERYQADYGITCEDQDAFTAGSHARAAAAMRTGRLCGEITPVTVSGRKGSVTVERTRACGLAQPLRCLPASARLPGR